MIRVIGANSPHQSLHDINPFLLILYFLDLIGPGTRTISMKYVAWMEGIICSDSNIRARCHSAKIIMQSLGKPGSLPTLPLSFATYMPTLLRFLELCEECHQSNPASPSTPQVPSQVEPEVIALQILRSAFREGDDLLDLAPMLVSVLARVLRADDRLQSRALGLELFAGLWRCWPSLPLRDGITPEACVRLMDAIGDPLQLNEPQPSTPTGERSQFGRGDQLSIVGTLLALTLADAWRDHLRPPNFASCSGIMSREGDRRQVANTFSRLAKVVTGLAEAQVSSTMFIKGLDRLKAMGSYGAVQLMLLHIWSSNEMHSFDEGAMKWLREETFELFYTHGMEHLDAFATHIKDCYDSNAAMATTTFMFEEADGAQCRARTQDQGGVLGASGREGAPSLQAMCRLRELYQAVGWDPARKEAVVSLSS